MNARHTRKPRENAHSYYLPQSRGWVHADKPLTDHRVHYRSAQPPSRDWRRIVLGIAVAVIGVAALTVALLLTIGDSRSASDREADFRSDTAFIPSSYGPQSEVLALGYGICKGLDHGIPRQEIVNVLVTSGLNWHNANLVIDSAQANLCTDPES